MYLFYLFNRIIINILILVDNHIVKIMEECILYKLSIILLYFKNRQSQNDFSPPSEMDYTYGYSNSISPPPIGVSPRDIPQYSVPNQSTSPPPQNTNQIPFRTVDTRANNFQDPVFIQNVYFNYILAISL